MEISKATLSILQQKARRVWEQTLLLHARVPEVRIASCLSATDLLSTLFYGGFLHLQPEHPLAPQRDRVIPSKGHGSLALYPILADLGFYPQSELDKITNPDAILYAIPSAGFGIFETINGSLGHGLGVGAGMAIALRTRQNPARVVVLHGDGELSEGAVWEAVMFAGQHQLQNLFLIIDGNGKSMLGKCDDILCWRNIEQRFAAFNWQTFRCNGHDLKELLQSYSDMFSSTAGQPKVLLAETVKGHGVPELEASDICHVLSLPRDRIYELIRQEGER